MTIRNWDGAIRATPRTPRSCDGPRGSVSMRPLGLADRRSLQARRALVSLASIAEWPVKNRCVSAPHDDMRRRRRDSHGWRGLARSDRVVRPREGDGSLIDARLVAASINYKPGWLLLLQMGKRVSERATRGGEGWNTAVSGHCIRAPRPDSK